MGFLDFLRFGNRVSAIEAYAKKGALIIDVRTHAEYVGGHVMGAKNIPLQTLQHEIAEIKSWNKPIIACCQSGMRSAQAVSLLKKNRIDCINGGGWSALDKKLAAI
jgi:rhodanese-related sulfurtransferase